MSSTLAVITGARGFVGLHTACAFHALGHPVVPLGRESPWVLPTHDGPAVLIHAAGVNRATDADVESGNVEAAARVIELLSEPIAWTCVIYVNSTQAGQDTPYGRSKAAAADLLAEACARNGIRFVNLVVPGVFGEGGRPDYNSFVATFCDRIVRGLEPEVHAERNVELIHAADLADHICNAALDTSDGAPAGERRVKGRSVTLHEVRDLITLQHRQYSSGILPDLSDRFERAMFATLRSFWFPSRYPIALDPKSDNRGHLVETFKVRSGGQCFMSWTHPGITRGNHFHRRKFERFLVLAGTADISLRRMFTDEVITFRVTGAEPMPVDMPTLHTHNITNAGTDELVTAFWTDEIFDPERPDTYGAPVMQRSEGLASNVSNPSNG